MENKVLLIDRNFLDFKEYFDKILTEKYVELFYSDSIEEGVRIIHSKCISILIINGHFISENYPTKITLDFLRQNFPHLPIVILPEQKENYNIFKDDDLISENSNVKNEKYQLNIRQKINYLLHLKKSIQFSDNKSSTIIYNDNENLISCFAYKLVTIAFNEDPFILRELINKANEWHDYLLRLFECDFSENLVYSLFATKCEQKRNVEVFLVFSFNLSKDKSENLKIEEITLGIDNIMAKKTEEENVPYLFERITDFELITGLMESSEKNVIHKIFDEPVCWGPLREFNLVNTPGEEIKAELLPGNFSFTKQINYQSLLNAMYSINGRCILALHFKPYKSEKNLRSFLDSIINGEIEAEIDPNQNESGFITALKEISNNKKNLVLFETRIGTDTLGILPNIFLNEVRNQFYDKNSTLKIIRQKGFYDNLFSIDPKLKVAPFTFLRNRDEAYKVFKLPSPASRKLQELSYENSNDLFIPDFSGVNGITLGEKRLGNEIIEIKVNADSLKKHMYILGQTGTGKTTVLKTMIADVMKKKMGCCVVDPHGDLFDEVLVNVPPNRKKDIVIFDTKNVDESVKLNLLNPLNNVNNSTLIDEILRILYSEFDMKLAGGPIFEMYFRGILKLVLHPAVVAKYHTPSLQLAYQALQMPELLRKLISLVMKPSDIEDDESETEELFSQEREMRELFKTAYYGKGEMEWDNVRPYIYSKLKYFVDNIYISELFDSKNPNLNFRDIMDTGKILLVRINKGQVGPANMTKVGRLFLNSLVQSIMSRADIRKEARKDFFVFIDEFQNFFDGDIGSAMSEVRKFNCGLILANQTLGQLSDYMLQSILGNAGNTIFFRTGINDVGKVRHFFEPEFTFKDLVNLDNFKCIARLMNEGKPTNPFLFETKLV